MDNQNIPNQSLPQEAFSIPELNQSKKNPHSIRFKVFILLIIIIALLLFSGIYFLIKSKTNNQYQISYSLNEGQSCGGSTLIALSQNCKHGLRCKLDNPNCDGCGGICVKDLSLSQVSIAQPNPTQALSIKSLSCEGLNEEQCKQRTDCFWSVPPGGLGVAIPGSCYRKSNAPSMKTIRLTDILPTMRLLPGDLSPNYNLIIRYIQRPEFTSDNKCNDQDFQESTQSCLIGEFNGFIIWFDKKGQDGRPQNRPWEDSSGRINKTDYKFLNFIVLNAPINQVEPYLSKYGKGLVWYDPNNIIYNTKEINGETILVIGWLNKEELQAILSQVGLDKNYDQLNNQLEFAYRGFKN